MKWIFIIFFATHFIGYSQVSESFADGNFTDNPQWTGTEAKFTINTNGQLQLKAPAETSDAWLFTQSTAIVNTTWQIDVQLKFNPSGQNYCKVFLAVDQSDPAAIRNGYYLLLGGTNDDISLYKIINGVNQLLIDGIDGRVAFDANQISIKVTSSVDGNWQLQSKNGVDWVLEGSAKDEILFPSIWFGIYCKYTSTRNESFYFDNIAVTGESYKDTKPLTVLDFDVKNDSSIALHFSKPIDSLAFNPTDIKLIPDEPAYTPTSFNNNTIEMALNSLLINKTHYQIHINGISDWYGTVIADTILYFDWMLPERYDLVISEFITDPEPTMGLPETEFIELYNRSDFEIDLSGYRLTVGEAVFAINYGSISVHKYVILASKSRLNDWKSFENVIGLDNFPSLAKTKGELILISEQNVVLDALRYDSDWNNGSFKDDGGWSFEMVDVENHSGDSDNWGYALNQIGGTPGQPNSIAESNLDNVQPVIHFISLTDTSATLHFSEPINFIQVDLAELFSFVPSDIKASEFNVEPNFQDKLEIAFANPLKTDVVCKMEMNSPLIDFAGNELMDYFPLEFGGMNEVAKGDVVINEILYNPPTDGSDFIEIVNRSGKILDLSDLYITQIDNNIPVSLHRLSEYHIPVMPQSYWVVAYDLKLLSNQYELVKPYWCIEPSGFPTMPDDEGHIALTNNHGEVIDELHYFDAWQYPLLNSTEGVSLEKINPDIESQSEFSWHSASAASGFATPGLPNSQFQEVGQPNTSGFDVQPKVFTPNNDGTDDVLNIQIEAKEEGGVLQLIVFDASGREVNHVANNMLLGMQNTLTWDGTNSSGQLAPPGIYVIWASIYYLNGEVVEYRKTCVIGVR